MVQIIDMRESPVVLKEKEEKKMIFVFFIWENEEKKSEMISWLNKNKNIKCCSKDTVFKKEINIGTSQVGETM